MAKIDYYIFSFVLNSGFGNYLQYRISLKLTLDPVNSHCQLCMYQCRYLLHRGYSHIPDHLHKSHLWIQIFFEIIIHNSINGEKLTILELYVFLMWPWQQKKSLVHGKCLLWLILLLNDFEKWTLINSKVNDLSIDLSDTESFVWSRNK